MENKIKVSYSLYTKNGKYNVMLRYKDPTDNSRKSKSYVLDIPELNNGGNKDKADAKAKIICKQFEVMINKKYTEKPKNPFCDLPIGKAMLYWLEQYKNKYQPNTYNSYLSYIKRMEVYFDDQLKTQHITLQTLTPDMILRFYNYLCSKSALNGKKISNNTLLHYHNIFHKFFDTMVKFGYINSNPTDKVDKPKINDTQCHNIEYSKDDIIKLLNLFKNSIIYPCVYTAIFTGMRRSEILALKWSDLDYQNGKILVHHKIEPVSKSDNINNQSENDSSIMKNSSSNRIIPMSNQLKIFFSKLKNEQMLNRYQRCRKGLPYYNTDYIMIKPDGNRISLSTLSDNFRRTIANSNLPKIRFHDLRHLTASLLLSNHTDMKVIQEILGHSSYNTTANIYTHTNYENLKSAMDTLSHLIGE